MKRTLFLIFICIISLSMDAQSERALDSAGNLMYQYNRTASYTGSGHCKVTVVFVNGNRQLGISYRQEVFGSNLRWTGTAQGDTSKLANIEVITANLAPNTSVAWTFDYQNKVCKKDKSINLERAGFLLLSDDAIVTKKIIPQIVVKAQ